jgi:hypothetical protein
MRGVRPCRGPSPASAGPTPIGRPRLSKNFLKLSRNKTGIPPSSQRNCFCGDSMAADSAANSAALGLFSSGQRARTTLVNAALKRTSGERREKELVGLDQASDGDGFQTLRARASRNSSRAQARACDVSRYRWRGGRPPFGSSHFVSSQ